MVLVQLANLDCSNFAIGCGKGDKRGHDQDCDVFSSHVDSDFDYLCYSIIVQLQLNLTFLDPPYPLTFRSPLEEVVHRMRPRPSFDLELTLGPSHQLRPGPLRHLGPPSAHRQH